MAKPEILQKGPKDAKQHTLATAAPFDTLESIAKKNAVKDGWETLALYLFGTKESDELNRALSESVGVAKVNLAYAEKTELKAMTGHSGKLALPEEWTDASFEAGKRYRLAIKKISAPTAIAITDLDKWFIPGLERNDIRYTVEGDPEAANKVDFSVYGSNYCECTDWNKGLGKYKLLENEPIFHEEGMKAPERGKNEVLNVTGADGKNAWMGQANPKKGMLSIKGEDEKERFVNVAFSPYTVHFRYRKTTDDKTAQLLLDPFWPQFEETKNEPAVTADFSVTPATFNWTNAEDQDYGVLEIFDATGQQVHLEVLKDDALTEDAKSTTWDKNYREDAFNGKFERTYLDDSGEATPLKKLLFKSTPYRAKVTTVKRQAKADSLKIKWEIKETTKLERGVLLVTDKHDTVVFRKALKKDEVGEKKHEHPWDGKYLAGVKNSRSKKTDPANTVYEVIAEDMPYRLQIQAHTPENVPEGLALAAMHSEVRLYVHGEDFQPSDLRYDPAKLKPSLALAKGPLVAGDMPQIGTDRELWFRHKLAEFGYHPGPVSKAALADAEAVKEYKIALKEFKRSVPTDAAAVAPNFRRQSLKATDLESDSAEAENALKSIRDNTYKREWLGKLSEILNNQENVDLTGEELERGLRDPAQDVVVWVDERQYYTRPRSSKDENDKDFLSGPPTGTDEGLNMGLDNYRGAMGSADGRTDTDTSAIARPWIPLQADLRLLSRKDPLQVQFKENSVFVANAKIRDAMRRAIGPLRVDWTFSELPPDLSTIPSGNYAHDKMRARKYVAWAMRERSDAHRRLDTGRTVRVYNCPELLGGARPAGLASYYKSVFGEENTSLEPWRATAVDDTQSIATVVHDRLIGAQVDKTDLFAPLIGSSGVYFHPSRIAGDGYQLRSGVRFEKFSGYEFPNLEMLAARYPNAPQAHSARLRNWRRSSMRGYVCWSNPKPAHWPQFLNRFRDQFRAAHVYFVHEGGTRQTFQVSDVFDPAQATHLARYRSIIKNNTADNNLVSTDAFMTLKSDFVWPFSDKDDFGWPYISDVDLPAADVWQKFLQDDCLEATWGLFSEALLFAILKEIEKKGVMRGHLFAEFKSSNRVRVRKYRCNRHASRGARHTYWMMERNGGPQRFADGATDCPAPSCYRNAAGGGADQPSKLRSAGTKHWDELPMWAEGNALGATWLFTNSDADTWVHEVGHHRHFEHAATAPGAQYHTNPSGNNELHDSQANEVAWPAPHAHTGDERWDRDCIMSYTTGAALCFCGKCLLRNRGWKIQNLGYPGPEVREPT